MFDKAAAVALEEGGKLCPAGVVDDNGNLTSANGSVCQDYAGGPSHAASFSLNANGSFSYTPAADYNGTDSFTYKANDGTADSNGGDVTVSGYFATTGVSNVGSFGLTARGNVSALVQSSSTFYWAVIDWFNSQAFLYKVVGGSPSTLVRPYAA